jgi:oligopeptide/dipeptide ABC transporter ATP-binding protein
LIAAAAPPGPLRDRLKQQYLVKGDPPSPVDPPPGCRFAQRCPFVSERCRVELPILDATVPDHQVACCRSGELEPPRLTETALFTVFSILLRSPYSGPPVTADEWNQQYRKDVQSWAELVKAANIKIE